MSQRTLAPPCTPTSMTTNGSRSNPSLVTHRVNAALSLKQRSSTVISGPRSEKLRGATSDIGIPTEPAHALNGLGIRRNERRDRSPAGAPDSGLNAPPERANHARARPFFVAARIREGHPPTWRATRLH